MFVELIVLKIKYKLLQDVDIVMYTEGLFFHNYLPLYFMY